jgi:hypothetical protein
MMMIWGQILWTNRVIFAVKYMNTAKNRILSYFFSVKK